MTTISTIANKLVSTVGPQLLGVKRLSKLAARFGRAAPIDLDSIAAKHRALYPESTVVGPEALSTRVLQLYHEASDPNSVVPDDQCTSVRSFVPYIRGRTVVVLYHFFRAGYGIKDPMLFRYSILDKYEVCWSTQILLAADGVVRIDDPDGEGIVLPETGTVLIEAFHPRASTHGDQIRYFGLYRDEAEGTFAGVHSLPCFQAQYPALAQPSYRGFGITGTSHSYHSIGSEAEALEGRPGIEPISRLTSESGVVLPGYIIAFGNGGAPTAIWHDGPSHHFVPLAQVRKTVGAAYTAFFVPNFSQHAPILFISASQIGFESRSATIYAYSEAGDCLATRTVAIHAADESIDLRRLFDESNIGGPTNIVIEFDHDIGEFAAYPAAYVHLYYRSPKGSSDQVHSHSTFGFAEDPFRRNGPYRCRKFGPLLADPKLEFIYSIINLGPNRRAVRDTEIRIRILTDTGRELVSKRKLSESGITNIRGGELFGGNAGALERVAVVQFEHETTNFNGTWFAIDRETGHLGTDHLTGG